MNRKANVYFGDLLAGLLEETDEYYIFSYNQDYLQSEKCFPISQTMPIQSKPFYSKQLFPFFDGLIPEGWLLNLVEVNWKINQRDRMGLLLACCNDCIGAVSIKALEDEL